jgi:diadenosine tetraphosphate (Ap4A) HIT family hydrolase
MSSIIDQKYEDFVLKEFKHWILLLHINQYPYVGRCYAWAKRDAKSVLDMLPDETLELVHEVLPLWNKAIEKLFKPDKVNFSIMCNETEHLHTHFIPRYKEPREVEGFKFVDHQNDGNYAPYAKPKLPREFLLKIKNMILNELK